jgi:glycosyltransferase involved in cell wall biosynthesis
MMSKPFTIAVVTYNTLFYTKLQLLQLRVHTPRDSYQIIVYDNGSTDGTREWLEQQPDVFLIKSDRVNDRCHGAALDYLSRITQTPVFCALDADAFPVSDDWLDPMKALDEPNVVLAGIGRGWGYTLDNYVHPSYLFGKTEFVRQHSFVHRWPAYGDKYDTGEIMTSKAYKYDHEVRFWKKNNVDFDGRFSPKPCDYAGLVWHVWWTSRKKVSPGLTGKEFEPDYHEFCKELFRKKYNLDF